MEIGHPTEVKHVNHVGWEVSSGSAPAWVSSVLIYFFCPKQTTLYVDTEYTQ